MLIQTVFRTSEEHKVGARKSITTLIIRRDPKMQAPISRLLSAELLMENGFNQVNSILEKGSKSESVLSFGANYSNKLY
jgi:hypothetical protein